ncbi:MAG: carbohydrate ABC transporter permease [Anaerolineaceae bacterium]
MNRQKMEFSKLSTWINDLKTSIKAQGLFFKSLSTLVLAAGAVIILIPFLYMIGTSVKDVNQIRQDPLGMLPFSPVFVEVNGKEEPLYKVDYNGEIMQMALIKKQPGSMAIFVDPKEPTVEHLLPVSEKNAVRRLDFHFENYKDALTKVPFGKYLLNTLTVTFIGMFGMMFSCSLVAFGLSRFRARWTNLLFLILLSTIMLPRQITLIPLYVIFQKLNWIDTLLPLIIPQFFANAYNVFLLRQFFLSIPVEMDEAAKIDGANTLQTLWYVILPQSRLALITIAIFHFLYAWNDFYEPLIFLHSRSNWTMAVGLQTFNAMYSINTHLIMAVSLMMVLPPIILFFVGQKYFTQGIVVSGVKG